MRDGNYRKNSRFFTQSQHTRHAVKLVPYRVAHCIDQCPKSWPPAIKMGNNILKHRLLWREGLRIKQSFCFLQHSWHRCCSWSFVTVHFCCVCTRLSAKYYKKKLESCKKRSPPTLPWRQHKQTWRRPWNGADTGLYLKVCSVLPGGKKKRAERFSPCHPLLLIRWFLYSHP